MRAAAGALLLLAGCSLAGGNPSKFVERLKANANDTAAMAELAIIGRASVKPLLTLLEEEPSYRGQVCATLAVAGEPCWPAMMDYLDGSGPIEIKRDVLEVFAAGRWKGVLNKLTNRLDHEEIGADAYYCLARILAGEEIPPDPWATGELDVEAIAAWNKWKGMNASRMVNLELRTSLYQRSELMTVKGSIEAELGRW